MGDPVAVLVGGMLAVDRFAPEFYRKAAGIFDNRAEVLTIPGSGLAAIPRSAAAFNRRLDKRFPGRDVALLCHSQAGCMASWAAHENNRIVQVACFGSPLNGTLKALIGYPFVRSTPDMLPLSRFVDELHPRLVALAHEGRIASIGVEGDRLVPWPSPYIDAPGARNYFCGTAETFRRIQLRRPDVVHIPTAGKLKPRNRADRLLKRAGLFEHIFGLTLLEPALRDLLLKFHSHAVSLQSERAAG